MKKAEKLEMVKKYLNNLTDDELWCNDTLWARLAGFEPTLTLKDAFNMIQDERQLRLDELNSLMDEKMTITGKAFTKKEE